MSYSSDAVKEWRKKTRNRMLKAFGGACCICGYNKCYWALHFHHLDQKEKKFAITTKLVNPGKWETLIKELRKCVLLCSNCHAEVHAKIVSIPKDATRFNEAYANYKEALYFNDCPICGEKKQKYRVTCSSVCAGKKSWTVPWDSIDLEELIKEHSWVEIGDILGVTANSVTKRAKKLGIYKKRESTI